MGNESSHLIRFSAKSFRHGMENWPWRESAIGGKAEATLTVLVEHVDPTDTGIPISLKCQFGAAGSWLSKERRTKFKISMTYRGRRPMPKLG